MLRQLEECTLGIVVERRGKTQFQGLEKTSPGGDQPIAVHPLVPTKGGSVHVEGRDYDVLLIMRSLVIKKLGDLEDSSHGVMTVKAWNV